MLTYERIEVLTGHLIWSGVLPQHPPTIFTSPSTAKDCSQREYDLTRSATLRGLINIRYIICRGSHGAGDSPCTAVIHIILIYVQVGLTPHPHLTRQCEHSVQRNYYKLELSEDKVYCNYHSVHYLIQQTSQ